jgi:DNA modification methylase
MKRNTIYHGNCLEVLKTLPDNSIDCCITSPPYYGLRNYGVEGQIGLEETPEAFVAELVKVFDEVKRVLKPTGQLWLNIGDSYAGSGKGAGDTTTDNWKQGTHKGTRDNGINNIKLKTPGAKPKDLIGVPWMLAFALRAAGWYLRQEIIWAKPNPMPESVTDRCTKAHEQIFLLTKSAQYFFDAEAIKTESIEPDDDRGSGGNRKRKPTQLINGIRNSGVYPKANKRSVWSVTTQPYSEAHFATFPEELIEPCILAGTSTEGCCAECGKPRERKLEKVGTSELRNGSQWKEKAVIVEMKGETSLRTSMHTTNELPVYETTGWKATCECNAATVPAVVLDPFSGAATTAIVAKKKGRDYIGIELNEKYIALSNKRLYEELGMFL